MNLEGHRCKIWRILYGLCSGKLKNLSTDDLQVFLNLHESGHLGYNSCLFFGGDCTHCWSA